MAAPDPVQAAEQILQDAYKKDFDKAHEQVFQLQKMTNLDHDQAHVVFTVYTRELQKMAKAEGMTLTELQNKLGEHHCLVLLGMVAGGVHCGTQLCFGGPDEGDDNVL